MATDPQYGIAHILRPYPGFEAVYQTIASTRPIMLTEANAIQDPNAGKPGYDPQLVAGLKVALGQRVLVALPIIPPSALAGVQYNYRFMWRMRNTFDYRQSRIPYHLSKQGAGVPDAGSPRVVLPAINSAIVYNPTEPVAAQEGVVSTLRISDISPRTNGVADLLGQPLNATGVDGHIQQGVYDPAVTAIFAYSPLFSTYDVVAMGDELLIGVWRTGDPWAFNAAQIDNSFSRLLGIGSGQTFPDVGVYVCLGAGP